MKELFEGEITPPIDERMFLSVYKDENKKYKWNGRFNQGVVTLNLPQIGLLSQNDENAFF